MIEVIEKNEGEKIPYYVSGTKIVFGDDELMINCKSRQRDYDVMIDICRDTQDGLTVGVNTEAREYVAQIDIPAREYEEVETLGYDDNGEPIKERVPIDFNMSKCTLTLWAIN